MYRACLYFFIGTFIKPVHVHAYLYFLFSLPLPQAHDCSVRTIDWSHGGKWMVTADDRGFIKYWQINFNNVHTYQAHSEPIRRTRWGYSRNDGLFIEVVLPLHVHVVLDEDFDSHFVGHCCYFRVVIKIVLIAVAFKSLIRLIITLRYAARLPYQCDQLDKNSFRFACHVHFYRTPSSR